MKTPTQFFFFPILLSILIRYLPSCDFKKSDKAGGSYVKRTVNDKGQARKGYARKKVSTDKNAILNKIVRGIRINTM